MVEVLQATPGNEKAPPMDHIDEETNPREFPPTEIGEDGDDPSETAKKRFKSTSEILKKNATQTGATSVVFSRPATT